MWDLVEGAYVRWSQPQALSSVGRKPGFGTEAVLWSATPESSIVSRKRAWRDGPLSAKAGAYNQFSGVLGRVHRGTGAGGRAAGSSLPYPLGQIDLNSSL